jgi:hypothetical protein
MLRAQLAARGRATPTTTLYGQRPGPATPSAAARARPQRSA